MIVTVLVRFEETTVDVGEADGQVTVTLTATPAATQAFQIMFRCFPDSAGGTKYHKLYMYMLSVVGRHSILTSRTDTVDDGIYVCTYTCQRRESAIYI